MIEIATRKGFSQPLNKETGDKIREALKLIFERIKDPIIHIQFDKGSQFTDKNTLKMLDSEHITYNFCETEDKTANGIVERFNRTIRQILIKYFTLNGLIYYLI